MLQQDLLNIDGVDSAKLDSVQTFNSRLELEITIFLWLVRIYC